MWWSMRSSSKSDAYCKEYCRLKSTGEEQGEQYWWNLKIVSDSNAPADEAHDHAAAGPAESTPCE
jgi:hypothetical protein